MRFVAQVTFVEDVVASLVEFIPSAGCAAGLVGVDVGWFATVVLVLSGDLNGFAWGFSPRAVGGVGAGGRRGRFAEGSSAGGGIVCSKVRGLLRDVLQILSGRVFEGYCTMLGSGRSCYRMDDFRCVHSGIYARLTRVTGSV